MSLATRKPFLLATLAFFAFSFLAWQAPQSVHAQRPGKAVKATKAAKPGRAVRMTRAVKKALQRKKNSKVRPVKAKKVSGFARVKKGLVLRASVRAKNTNAKSAIANGQLASAANLSTKTGVRNSKGQFTKGGLKLSIRERFSNWRANRAVKNAAFSQAKSRSKNGNLEGTADALAALNTLQASGKLGFFARWKKARVTNKVFKNLKSAARNSLKSGQVEAAGQTFLFATGIKPGTKAASNLAKTLVKDSFKLAVTFSKSGQPELTYSVLNMAASISAEANIKFSEKKAQKIVDAALTKAVPAYTKMAQKAYRSGDVTQAVSLLAEARSIQRGSAVKASRSVKRTQAKLVKNLGPALTSFEAAQAQQAQPEA